MYFRPALKKIFMSQKRKRKYKKLCVAAKKKVDSSKWLAVKDAREPKKKEDNKSRVAVKKWTLLNHFNG
jgi:hypothetical protein